MTLTPRIPPRTVPYLALLAGVAWLCWWTL